MYNGHLIVQAVILLSVYFALYSLQVSRLMTSELCILTNLGITDKWPWRLATYLE